MLVLCANLVQCAIVFTGWCHLILEEESINKEMK